MTRNKLIIFVILLIGISNNLKSQTMSPAGVWKSVNDQTGVAKSHVEIFQSGTEWKGKIVKLLNDPEDSICELCQGSRKNKKVLGMTILTGLKQDGNKFVGGTILDPENGKEYKCQIWLENDQKLAVRGYIGIPTMGRTQTWERVR